MPNRHILITITNPTPANNLTNQPHRLTLQHPNTLIHPRQPPHQHITNINTNTNGIGSGGGNVGGNVGDSSSGGFDGSSRGGSGRGRGGRGRGGGGVNGSGCGSASRGGSGRGRGGRGRGGGGVNGSGCGSASRGASATARRNASALAGSHAASTRAVTPAGRDRAGRGYVGPCYNILPIHETSVA
ncbi:hypothetical protein FB389_1561 [Rarobacter incanus]|uniref:Uncharacterized protein n=1 Tax=Rarobacter incanus TaxID=153494 RepID=A0A542SQH0_9MICO|nr:hypothetical protein FB389_1561 [Rarobacter incanus]